MLLIFLKTNWGYEMCMEYWKEKGATVQLTERFSMPRVMNMCLTGTQASQSVCHQNDWYTSEVYLPTV